MKITKRQLRRIIKEERAVLEQSWRQNPAKIRRERRQRDRQRMIDTMTFEQLKRRAFDSAQGINGRLSTGQYEYADIWEAEIPMLADYIDAAKIKAAEEGVTYDDIPEVRHNGGIVDLSDYSLGDLPDTVKESKMKITRTQLRQIIKEAIINEAYTENDINMSYGFYGQIEADFDENTAKQLFDQGVQDLQDKYKLTEEEAVGVLNSKMGRKAADEVYDGQAKTAIEGLEAYYGKSLHKEMARNGYSAGYSASEIRRHKRPRF